VLAERAIAFKLAFIEPLVGRGLIRELWVLRFVAQNIRWLIAVERRLQVEQDAGRNILIHVFVMNFPDHAMPFAQLGRGVAAQTFHVDLDVDAEIGAAFFDRVA
jgi:hypothetical protein